MPIGMCNVGERGAVGVGTAAAGGRPTAARFRVRRRCAPWFAQFLGRARNWTDGWLDFLRGRVMSTNARRRLMKDVKRMRTEEHEGIMLSEDPVDNNIMKWHAVIVGPDDTLWEDLVATLLLEFTEEYPDKPPKISFLTKMVRSPRSLLQPPPTQMHDHCVPAPSSHSKSHPVDRTVPSECLCRRLHMPRHLAKPMVAHVRNSRHPVLHPVPALRPKSRVACQPGSREALRKGQERIRAEGQALRGSFMERWAAAYSARRS